MPDSTLSSSVLAALYNQLDHDVRQAATLDLKLKIAAENVVRIATALAEQSELLLDEFEPQVIDSQGFQEFVQQSRFVDLDEWIEEISWTRSSIQPEDLPEELMNDEQLAEFLQVSQASLENHQLDEVEIIKLVTHDENVTDWSEQILQCLNQSHLPISLVEVAQRLGIPLVSVWLGGLLSESIQLFREREYVDEHEFYEIDVFAVLSINNDIHGGEGFDIISYEDAGSSNSNVQDPL